MMDRDLAVLRALLLACVLAANGPHPAFAAQPGEAAANDEAGRDFPKTLIFDEPGIDDEVSLPTLLRTPQHAPYGTQTDIDFELDKRLTTWLSLQINIGYTALPNPHGTDAGWQNSAATLKFITYQDHEAEQLVSVSLTREFGRSGAVHVGAAPFGASTAAVNFGQGFSPVAPATLLAPFAITGSAGVLLPDRQEAAQAVLSASAQYSFDVLMGGAAGRGLPAALRPLIPIVECVYTGPGSTRMRGLLAPGLIYAGRGYQLAAEALVPLTRAAGNHPGFIAQLNISLSRFGVPALARPLF